MQFDIYEKGVTGLPLPVSTQSASLQLYFMHETTKLQRIMLRK